MAQSASSTTSGSSTSAFVSTLIPALVVAGIFLLIFCVFKDKYPAVYQPRAVVETVPESIRAKPQPKGPYKWFSFILSQPTPEIIREVSVDGFFFLRYLRNWMLVGTLSGVVIWCVLLPINATGGGGKTGFDTISYANNTHKWRVFAHLFCSWLFFGLVLYMIYSELVFYTTFRHALQTSPLYASLPFSKTLLVDNIPEGLLNETELKRLFPGASKFYIPEDTKDLRKLIKKRTKLAKKFEGGMTKMITKSCKARSKAEKKGETLPTPAEEPSSYFAEKKLPKYSLGKPLISSKKPLLTDGYTELGEFNTDIKTMQDSYGAGEHDKEGSAFIQFPNNLELERAYQAIPYCSELPKSRRFTGMAPEDVVWDNVGTGFGSRMSKKTGAVILLTLTIIFWSVPVAFVGMVSNINYLTEKIHWLRFINNMPGKLMGIITGLAPTVALAILMSLLPPYIRKLGKVSGCLTVQQVEEWTQQWFFAFQVVQTFLVTTLASAAASSVSAIIDNPSNALNVLAEYLPPASNFYICYIVLKGIAIPSGSLAQIVPLALSFVLGPLLDKTPRQKWNRAHKLGAPAWGTTYANYGLFTVILLAYAIIAPIIIAFTVVAFFLIYVSFLYNLTYVSDHQYDSRGRNYVLALFEVFVAMYVAQLCLCGLFVTQKNWACVALEAVMIAVTVAVHLYCRWTFEPLFETVPVGAIFEVEGNQPGQYPLADRGLKQVKETGKSYFKDSQGSVADTDAQLGEQPQKADDASSFTFKNNSPQINEKQAEFGSSGNGGNSDSSAPAQGTSGALESGVADVEKKLSNLPVPVSLSADESFSAQLKHFLHPRSSYTLDFARSLLPSTYKEPCVEKLADDVDYSEPAVADVEPTVWIPKDDLGMADKMIDNAEGKFIMTDENAVVDEKNKAQYTGYPPDYTEELTY